MSEAVEEAAVAAPASTGPSAGTIMRRAREASGLHVAALAVSLKVPVRKLEALEADHLELVGDPVFVRALAGSVCRSLKIDPHPVLERLPQGSAPRLVKVTDGINAPFRAPSDGAPPSWVDQLSRPVFLAVFALLLGAAILLLLPIAQRDKGDDAKAAAGAPAVEAAASPVPLASQPVVLASPDAPPGNSPAPAATAPVPAAATASAPVAEAAPVTTGIVVFRTTSDSWVEVTDAKGASPLKKILAAGETAGASGTPPLKVTIGRADVTQVQVRGKPFDLRPVSTDNVARFEVK